MFMKFVKGSLLGGALDNSQDDELKLSYPVAYLMSSIYLKYFPVKEFKLNYKGLRFIYGVANYVLEGVFNGPRKDEKSKMVTAKNWLI